MLLRRNVGPVAVLSLATASCQPAEETDPARGRGWNPSAYTKGTTISRGRVPGRPDRHEEEPDVATETTVWNGWRVSLKPPVVRGLPGDKHDAIVRLEPDRPEPPAEGGTGDGTAEDGASAAEDGSTAPAVAAAPPPEVFNVRHGEWGWLALALKDLDIHPDGSLLRLHVVIPFDESVTRVKLPTEPFEFLPGPRLEVERGEVVATATATSTRDASDIPRGVGVEVDGRNVRVLHALGRRDYQDCGHALQATRDFELQRLGDGRFLVVGVVEESSGECRPGGPHNPRLEASFAMPDAGELRVVVFSRQTDAVGGYWAVSDVTVEVG